jgi:hypothetical protein
MKGLMKQGIVIVLFISFMIGVGLHIAAGNHAQLHYWPSKIGYIWAAGLGFYWLLSSFP